jgi:hypothetical protein
MSWILIALKSLLVSQIISWGKWFIFREKPDWEDPESVRAFGLKHTGTLDKFVKITGIKWDDALAARVRAILENPVVFEVLYSALIEPVPVPEENIRMRLLAKIRSRLSLSNSASEMLADELAEAVRNIQGAKKIIFGK